MTTEQATSYATSANPQKKHSSRKQWFQVISVLFTLGLMIFILRLVEWDVLGEMVFSIPLAALLGAFVMYTLLNVFRAVRFRALLDRDDAPMKLLLPITFYHNFLVRVLPFKMGEFSYIILLRNRLGYRVEEGVSSLFGARLLELIVIIFVMGVAALASGGQLADQQSLLISLSVISFIGCIVSLYYSGRILGWLVTHSWAIFSRLVTNPPQLLVKIKNWLLNMSDELSTLQKPKVFIRSLFITIFTYLGSFFTFWILLRGIGLDTPFALTVGIISLGMFASAFPFSVSGFGVVEFSWAVGLIWLAGYGDGEASAVGLFLHGFQIISATIIGVLGYIAIQLQPEEAPVVQSVSS